MSTNYGAIIINTNGEESAHVHRSTSYIASLKNNWAYKNKSNMPKLKNSLQVYNNNLESRFINSSSK